MFERVIHLAAATLLASGLLLGQSDLKVRQAELSTMFGSAAGYIATVNGDVLFVNTEKPEMSMHIPGKTITSSSVNEGTLTIVTAESIYGLTTFNFKLADPSATFELAPGAAPGPASQAATRFGASTQESADTGAVLQTFEVRHDHFPRGGCEGRLIVREDRIQFESMTDIGHSQMWRMSDIKEIKRKNPYKLELNPFVGSAYNFEVLRQGMSPSDFEFITKRIANSRLPR